MSERFNPQANVVFGPQAPEGASPFAYHSPENFVDLMRFGSETDPIQLRVEETVNHVVGVAKERLPMIIRPQNITEGLTLAGGMYLQSTGIDTSNISILSGIGGAVLFMASELIASRGKGHKTNILELVGSGIAGWAFGSSVDLGFSSFGSMSGGNIDYQDLATAGVATAGALGSAGVQIKILRS